MVHDVAPWQHELVQADGDRELSPEVRALFEREANVGAAQLLFQQGLLGRVAGQYKVGIGTIIEVATTFGSTVRATARQYARTHQGRVMTIVLDLSPLGLDPLRVQRREVTCSKAWGDLFGPWRLPSVLDLRSAPWLADAVSTPRGSTRSGSTTMRDGGREPHTVDYEFINTSYQLIGVFSIRR